MNLGIVIINSYYLYQMYTKKDLLKLLAVSDMSYFNVFVSTYEKDMKHFMSFDEALDQKRIRTVLCLKKYSTCRYSCWKKK